MHFPVMLDIPACNIMVSGVIPAGRSPGIFGPCAGGAVYSPLLRPTLLFYDWKNFFICSRQLESGKDCYRRRRIAREDLGGAFMHQIRCNHFTAGTGEEGLSIIRHLSSFIPQNNLGRKFAGVCCDPIDFVWMILLNEIILRISPNKPVADR